MSNITSHVCLRGSVDFMVDGVVVESKKNLVVNTGKDYVASRILDGSSAVLGWIAVGTGAGAPAAGDTALANELSRVAVSSASRVGNIVTYVANFGPGVAVGTLTEAGLFNAAGAGIMMSRVNVGPHTISPTSSFSITWNIEVL